MKFVLIMLYSSSLHATCFCYEGCEQYVQLIPKNATMVACIIIIHVIIHIQTPGIKHLAKMLINIC